MKIDPTSIKYRKANSNDIKLLVNYRIEFLKEVHNYNPDKEIELRKKLEEYVTRCINKNTLHAWIADYGDITIGMGWMLVRDQPGHFYLLDGKIGLILNIYTIPTYRRNGISSQIMQHLIDDGKSLKLNRLELRATLDGEPVYRNFGFSEPSEKTMELILK